MADPRVSVVVCAHTERRFPTLIEAIASLREQSVQPDEIVLVIDHDDRLLARARDAFPDVRVVASSEPRGLSGARNTGARVARGAILAFLDDDARADRDWLSELMSAYTDPTVIGAGGLVVPRWQGSVPSWLAPEFLWTVGCSYTGLPRNVAPVRNPIGANMSVRRDALREVGGFTDGLGRVGSRPMGCEETELFIRLAQAHPDGLVLHVPAARVDHLVPLERGRWTYFRARCWAEGLSKALVAGRVGGRDALASERAHVARALRRGVARDLALALRGDVHAGRRAAASVAGLLLAAGGYARGRLSVGATGS